MTKAHVEVIKSVQRRRRWSRAEKERIVAAALEPGGVASEVARAAGIHTSQLFRWRQQLCERTQIPAVFNPVTVAPEPDARSSPLPETGSASPEAPGVIEIEFAAGGRMRICGAVAASTVSALMKALADPVRLQIVDVLRRHAGEVCVCDLESLFPISQPTLSHHLKKLLEAGVVDVERREQWAYYYVIPGVLTELSRWLG